MLQLQRASAGSGKTYTLARKFIEFFISVKDGERRRLRTRRELRDSLGHILAITFTNKATNEMKLRIVEKLDALGSWTPAVSTGKVDYLDDFCLKFKATPEQVADTARQALSILLNDYGDFKVSTIDSFFQTVLRTFAYEADLDETYQIELDSDYVTQVGLDTTLDEIDTSDSPSAGFDWIRQMIAERSESSKGWNIFQKNERGGSVYAQILKAARNLGKEDFKVVREELDAYFQAHPDFHSEFLRLSSLYEDPLKAPHARMRKAARALRDAFAEAGLDIDATAGQYLAGRSKSMAQEWDWNDWSEKGKTFSIPEFTRKGTKTRVFDPKKDNPWLDTPTEDHIEALAAEMYEAFDEWRNMLQSPELKKWRMYKATMPYLGLLQTVIANSREFLNDSNTVELGETNSILRRIIGDDDAPFVYERLGSRLEHFLIDEFQDTSRLQWANLRPLVAESEGKGNDNLIIGDAKQSIYRFRNADPSLITSRVPEQFAATVRECGDRPAENTNWRSMRRIVEFNNLFFRYFTRSLSPEMESLYSNTVQPPHHREEAGYVRVELFPAVASGEDPDHFGRIPDLIEDMLGRGYRQNEIAVLVDRVSDGRKIIEYIMAHNRDPRSRHKIEFISAESLQVGDASSVQTLVSVLEAIDKGTRAELRHADERRRKGIGDWSKLKAAFSFFAMSHRDLTLSEQMSRFLGGDYDPNVISDMLAGMHTTALPALVEATIEKFLPDSLRKSEAPFLAAFQDIVGEFCEGHSTDIASFLQWWERKGRRRSVASPEGADAVEIMTVHKSKGLEFRCVIVANSMQTIRPTKTIEREWLWVRPQLHNPTTPQLRDPLPWLPVWSDQTLLDTPHAADYEEYLRKYMMDKVNMAYVAYTRAVDELYIFTPYKEKKGEIPVDDRIGGYLWQLARNASRIIPELESAYHEISDYIPRPEDISIHEDTRVWELGELPDRETVEAAHRKRQGKKEDIIDRPIEDYRSSSSLPQLCYADPTDPDVSESEDPAPEDSTPEDLKTTGDSKTPEDTAAQRIGELLHGVMERIEVESDLHSALIRQKSKGLINFDTMLEWEPKLAEALRSVREYGWFDPGVRVLNERAMMMEGGLCRPDRVILRPDRSAVIVDYKFGDHRDDTRYSRQLARYARALSAAGTAKKTEAYIWYVSLGIVVRC